MGTFIHYGRNIELVEEPRTEVHDIIGTGLRAAAEDLHPFVYFTRQDGNQVAIDARCVDAFYARPGDPI